MHNMKYVQMSQERDLHTVLKYNEYDDKLCN